MTDEDEERYEKFNTVVGAHWQFEMMGKYFSPSHSYCTAATCTITDSIFEVVNTARDKEEAKERQKYTKAHVGRLHVDDIISCYKYDITSCRLLLPSTDGQ